MARRIFCRTRKKCICPLKLLRTYDAGESIESSAAISGGTVYVGSQSKDLLAIDLATGKLRWKYRATDFIRESSPAVASGKPAPLQPARRPNRINVLGGQ